VSEESTASTEAQENGAGEVKTFTQDEVNALLAKQKREHRAEVSGLQSKVEEGKTLEQRLAEVEQRAAKAEAAALRSDIAAKHGISAEDRDLFLTGVDEETLTAQAQRLAQREADRKKQGNVAPKEGGNPNPSGGGGDLREFTRNLFRSAQAD
jgi:murein DD-endopeptidase MepM/ murein hydrolase activator NlpD